MNAWIVFILSWTLAQGAAGRNLAVSSSDSVTVPSIIAQLDSVRVPHWKLDFGLFSLPRLNDAQKMKKQYLTMLGEIERLEEDVLGKAARLQDKKETLQQLLQGELKQKDDTRVALGLYRRQKMTQGTRVVYNEKSLFWGAIKWGKRKPRTDQHIVSRSNKH